MTKELSTIPDLLVKTRGNMTEAALQLNVNRATIRKYARDFDGKHHAIVGGTLMVETARHMLKKQNRA